MNSRLETERWERLGKLFHIASEMDPQQCTVFLREECGDDPELRQKLEALLASATKTLRDWNEPIEKAVWGLVGGFAPAVSRIGPYELIRPLGQGGMGRVYLAARADQQYRQTVALKLMHTGVWQNQEMLLRFRAERQILANLRHPNIGRLLEGGVTANGSPTS
jgi:eukaryotic-like serine/threonine-protein kinase